MKSVHNLFVTKQKMDNYVRVGNAVSGVKSFTKADFMTPEQVAEKFKISTQEAKKLMLYLFKYKKLFIVNGHKSPIIVKIDKNTGIVLHPLGTPAFEQYLQKQRG